MRDLLTALILLASTLQAISLDELLTQALQKNPSLESMTHRISANRSALEVSDHYANPELTYLQNTIDADQAMSQKTLSLKQKLPYFGKRESLQKVALAEEAVLQGDLKSAKVRLVNAIKEEAYHVWELEQQRKIIHDYVDLTQQNIELFESYTSSSEGRHMGIMSAALTLSDLRIQETTIEASIDSAYARLSYLSASQVRTLDIDLKMGDISSMQTLRAGLRENPEVALKSSEVAKRKAMHDRADLDNYPDVMLLGGYSFREEFDDYWTFGVGVSLPIYGTEDAQEEEARKLTLAAQSLQEDTKVAVDSAFRSAYVQMRSAHEVYHVINDEALVQVDHMFDLMSSSISTGGDLFDYIEILIQKLKLEKKSIKAVADFHRASAKISSLSGALR